MRNKIQKMIRYYDERAPWHDQYMSYTDIESFEKRLHQVIETIEGYIKDKSVLEIACGTGNWTQILALRAGSVHAVDSSGKSLEIAREKTTGFNNIRYYCSDIYEPYFKSEPCDVLFSSDFWSHVPLEKIPSLVERLKMLMKPEASLIMVDMTMREFFKNEQYHIDQKGNRVSIRELPDGTVSEVIKNFPTENELKGQLAGYFRSFKYIEFDEIERWMIICKDLV